jgi:fluoride ion exporter CrcB/FEX
VSSELARSWLPIAAGGAAGACLRHAIALVVSRLPSRSPAIDASHATLAANLFACFVLGLLGDPGPVAAAAAGPDVAPEAARAWTRFAALGFCGSLSTFSTLCADGSQLARAGWPSRAAIYWLLHLLAGPTALGLGARLAH